MRVLLISSTGTPYVPQLWQNIKKYYSNVKFSLLTIDRQEEFYRSRLDLEEGEEIYTYSYDKLYIGHKKAINALPQFDIIQPLWMEWQIGLHVNELKKKAKYIYISVGGSDLYRDSKRFHVKLFQKQLIKKASYLSSENSTTRNYFYEVYGKNISKAPHEVINFGVDIIDSARAIGPENKINLRKKWNVPEDKYVVACGHNGRREHQHIAMLDAISKMDKALLDKMYFIIPMTYLVPSEDYVKEVEEKIKSFTNNYVILRKFMNVDEMAETTAICDCMIHVQTTDQLSSVMVAHMYCGNTVIAGSWLPYETLREAGIEFYSVNEIDEITERLSEAVFNKDDYRNNCKKNADIVYKLSSWEYAVKKWYGVYEELIMKK